MDLYEFEASLVYRVSYRIDWFAYTLIHTYMHTYIHTNTHTYVLCILSMVSYNLSNGLCREFQFELSSKNPV